MFADINTKNSSTFYIQIKYKWTQFGFHPPVSEFKKVIIIQNDIVVISKD
jgi:hypothetical protein